MLIPINCESLTDHLLSKGIQWNCALIISFSHITEEVVPVIVLPDKSKNIPLSNKTPVDINIGDNVTAAPETTLNIHCPISGTPTPEVTWFKDGKKVNVSRNVYIHENFTLTVRRARPEDSGKYRCVAESIAGSDSVTSDVTVIGKWIFMQCMQLIQTYGPASDFNAIHFRTFI